MDTESGLAEAQGAPGAAESSLVGLLTQRPVGGSDAAAGIAGGGWPLQGPSKSSAFQAVQPQSQGDPTWRLEG